MCLTLNYDDQPPASNWDCEETSDGVIATWRPGRRLAWAVVLTCAFLCLLQLLPFGLVNWLGIDGRSMENPPSVMRNSILTAVFIIVSAWAWVTARFMYVRYRVSPWGVTFTSYWPPRARVRVWRLSDVGHFGVETTWRSRLDKKGLHRLELHLVDGSRHSVLGMEDERVPVWLAAHLQSGLERARAASVP